MRLCVDPYAVACYHRDRYSLKGAPLQEHTDLRTYLHVIWRKKWLILSIFALIVAGAAVYLFRLPTQYEATALLRLQSLPPVEKIQLKPQTLQKTAEVLQSDELLLQIAQDVQPSLPKESGRSPMETEQWLKQSLKVLVLEKAELLELTLSGSLAPQQLSEILGRVIALTKTRLEAELKTEAELQINYLSNSVSALDEQLNALNDRLKTEIVERKRILEGQRTELQHRIDGIRGNPQFLRLQVGEQNATLQGVLLRQEFVTLNERIKAIEEELQQLDSQGRSLFPEINARLKNLEEERTNLLTLVAKNRQILATSWESLSIVSTPYASDRPVGPKRFLNLLIAGILGLLLGTLIALFRHYLEQPSTARTA